jgi:hypothetical protein
MPTTAQQQHDDNESFHASLLLNEQTIMLQEENQRLFAEVRLLREQLSQMGTQQQQVSSSSSSSSPRRSSPTKNRNYTLSQQDTKAIIDLDQLPQPQQLLHHRIRNAGTNNSNKTELSSLPLHLDCERGLLNEVEPTQPISSSNSVVPALNNPYHSDSMDPIHFLYQVQDRATWLVGLLVLQSMSSFIIAHNQALLQKHTVLIQFLTMLVGAGGNAGNQASVRVIRGLATGQITMDNVRLYLWMELKSAVLLCCIVGTAGGVRALLFFVPLPETVAITTSLCLIVLSSIVLEAILPLGMKAVHIDPAHSSTSIQVLMDILGVTITVFVGSLILDSPLRQWFFSTT